MEYAQKITKICQECYDSEFDVNDLLEKYKDEKKLEKSIAELEEYQSFIAGLKSNLAQIKQENSNIIAMMNSKIELVVIRDSLTKYNQIINNTYHNISTQYSNNYRIEKMTKELKYHQQQYTKLDQELQIKKQNLTQYYRIIYLVSTLLLLFVIYAFRGKILGFKRRLFKSSLISNFLQKN